MKRWVALLLVAVISAAVAVLVTVLVIVINVVLQRIQSHSLAWRPMDRDMIV